VTKKIVAADEAYGKAVDKSGFEAALKRAGHVIRTSERSPAGAGA
jgi:hypothetical protein